MQFSNKNLNDIQNGSDPAEVLLLILNADNSDEYIKKLIHLCDSGGYPDDENKPKYKILHSSKDDKYYSIVVEVIFDEKTHGQGCSVVPEYRPRYGEVEFKISINSGEVISVS